MKTVALADITLAVEDQGAGPPLVLVHGFPLNHLMWKDQIAAMKDRYRVLAPDLRGFGASGVSEGAVSMERFADDLAAMLDQLAITAPVVLCGLSMGGYIAFAFWRKYPARVAKLILCDTLSTADTAEAAAGRRQLSEKVLAQGAGVVVAAMTPKLFAKATQEGRPEVVQAVQAMMSGTDPRGIVAALGGMALRPDSTSLLPGISVPTLVLVGAEDVISPPEKMQHIAASIPNAQYVTVPAAGHMAPMEQPATVNEAIKKFLAT